MVDARGPCAKYIIATELAQRELGTSYFASVLAVVVLSILSRSLPPSYPPRQRIVNPHLSNRSNAFGVCADFLRIHRWPTMAPSGSREARPLSHPSQGIVVSSSGLHFYIPTLSIRIRLFVRLTGIQEAPVDDAMNIDDNRSEPNYPPTFNVQNEVEEFTVRPYSGHFDPMSSLESAFSHR